MNLPNKLTVFRLLITPVFVVLLNISFTGNYTLALILFMIGMTTDYFDGSLARARGEVTNFGRLMDPLVDKLLISSAFISFIGLPEIRLPSWMVIVIVSREFTITGLRLVVAGRGVILPAGKWGKHKTVSQVVTVCAILLYLCLFYDSRLEMATYRPFVLGLTGMTMVLTIGSGLYYMVQNRKFFLQEGKKQK
jgi:CDP-diacylglycerol--glycerol-3-phosphate 3-phosphatidyltransferase